ncbi:MAG: carboxylesterase family protein [Selenomonadaceae bacterium]|nr:carboxylesterase family protein [Selenomonadaceae bacterium]
MKKLFTVDNFIVAGISGIAYGLGFKIPQILGYEEWQCGIICMVVGFALDKLANTIVFSKTVQSSKTNRVLAVIGYILFCASIEYAFAEIKDISIDDYAMEGYAYLVVPTILGFAFSMAVRWYRVRKIRERYGDGSGGFMFDNLHEKVDLDELNSQNQQIHGAFDTDCAVKTKTGFFVGEKIKDALFFCGIPYAKPPVGKLRWKAPEPLPESEDVFEAKYLGASAIQVDYDGSPLKLHRQSEDCLYLNICVGAQKTDKKKPVIVIFHHGDFSYGGAADPILFGGQFNKIYPDAICVTFNYRLGIFGFIDFSEVPGGENYPDALNLGLLDQIAALRWIRENISSFGGDPEKITVMGFEAGALSISLLAACEQAKGLFKKAFVFHGSPMAAYGTPEVSRELAKKLLQETSTTTMAELSRLPMERLKKASQKLALNLSAPTRDGKLIPVDAYAAYLNGAAAGVEFLIGIAANEMQIFEAAVGSQKYENSITRELDYILNYIDANNPAAVQDVKNYIAARMAATSEFEAKAEVVEQVYALSTYQCAKRLADGGNRVHLLCWGVKPVIEKLGSGTVDVLAAFLGNSEAVQIYGSILNKDIAETLQTLFWKFVSGKELRLYNNEIKGVGDFDWKKFPQALIVSEKEIKCKPIVDELTEVKALIKIFAE